MSRFIALVWFAALVILVGALVVSPAAAQPLAGPNVLTYRGGVLQPAPTRLSPQQGRQQSGQPANDGRPDDKSYSYNGDPSTTDRAYEVPGGSNAYTYGNPSVPPVNGRPLPAYLPPNYQAPSYYQAPDYRPPGYQPQHAPVAPAGNDYLAEYSKELPLWGCDIVAANGTFLGAFNRDYASQKSLANRNGPYASPYSRLSIYNADGPYGNPRSPLSAWNTQTTTPPALYWHGNFKCYVTMNPRMFPRVTPMGLVSRLNTPAR